MLRSSLLSSARPVFAAPATAAEGAADITPKANRQRQAANKDKPDQTGPKAVYLTPERTAADIVVRLESYAEASLRFLSAIVVHMCVRTYSLVDGDRVSDNKALMAEIEGIIQTYAKGKRGGKQFEHAWTSRIISTARAMAVKLIKDGAGISGISQSILRARTVDAANEHVFKHCLAVTKGQNSFTALSKMLAPANAGKAGKGGAPAKGAGSNAVAPVKGTNAAVAKRVLSDKGFEVLNAIPGKAAAKATKLADTIGKSNVDHRVFVLRALTMIDNPETLLEIAEEAKKLARNMVKAKKDGEAAPAEQLAATG